MENELIEPKDPIVYENLDAAKVATDEFLKEISALFDKYGIEGDLLVYSFAVMTDGGRASLINSACKGDSQLLEMMVANLYQSLEFYTREPQSLEAE